VLVELHEVCHLHVPHWDAAACHYAYGMLFTFPIMLSSAVMASAMAAAARTTFMVSKAPKTRCFNIVLAASISASCRFAIELIHSQLCCCLLDRAVQGLGIRGQQVHQVLHARIIATMEKMEDGL
jgi:hypothetical protein